MPADGEGVVVVDGGIEGVDSGGGDVSTGSSTGVVFTVGGGRGVSAAGRVQPESRSRIIRVLTIKLFLMALP
jgi:hypothetical protein